MNRRLSAVTVGLIAMAAYTGSCRANTIIDWDAKATAVASSARSDEMRAEIGPISAPVDFAMGGGRLDAPDRENRVDNPPQH